MTTKTAEKAINNHVKNCDTVAWAELKDYELNDLKRLEKAQVEKLQNAIINRGFNFPFYLWADHRYVIDGTHRIIALKELEKLGYKIPDLPVVEIKAKDIQQAKRLVLYASSQYGELTQESFAEFVEDLDFEEIADELNFEAIDLELEPVVLAPEADPDDVPEIEGEPETKPGDLYEIGPHRLLCGDSTVLADVEKLMGGVKADMVFTDPPYGVSFQSNSRTKTPKFKHIENDDKFITDWIQHLAIVSSGWVFVWCSFKVIRQWIDFCSEIGELSNIIVLNKASGGMGDLKGTFATDYELALAFNRGAEVKNKRIGSVWSIGKDAVTNYKHPTQKPVELPETAIKHTTEEAQTVLDLFLGSGSTMVAAHQTKRICYGMEIDPHYCDVIVTRMRKLWPDIEVKRNGEVV